jgi:hypothetical protein
MPVNSKYKMIVCPNCDSLLKVVDGRNECDCGAVITMDKDLYLVGTEKPDKSHYYLITMFVVSMVCILIIVIDAVVSNNSHKLLPLALVVFGGLFSVFDYYFLPQLIKVEEWQMTIGVWIAVSAVLLMFVFLNLTNTITY